LSKEKGVQSDTKWVTQFYQINYPKLIATSYTIFGFSMRLNMTPLCNSQRNLTLSVLDYKFEEHLYKKSLGSVVGIANGYWLGDGEVGVRVPVG
jgi:hypothetical protein